MEEVEKEMLEDRPSEAAVEDKGMPGLARSIPTDKVMPGVTESIPTDPFPSSLPWKIFITLCFVRKNIVIFGAYCFEYVYLFPLNNLLGSSVLSI